MINPLVASMPFIPCAYMIFISYYIRKRMYFYTITIFTDGMAVCCHMCHMSLAGCSSAVVCGYVDIAKLRIGLCHCLCPVNSLQISILA